MSEITTGNGEAGGRAGIWLESKTRKGDGVQVNIRQGKISGGGGGATLKLNTIQYTHGMTVPRRTRRGSLVRRRRPRPARCTTGPARPPHHTGTAPTDTGLPPPPSRRPPSRHSGRAPLHNKSTRNGDGPPSLRSTGGTRTIGFIVFGLSGS